MEKVCVVRGLLLRSELSEIPLEIEFKWEKIEFFSKKIKFMEIFSIENFKLA